MSDDAKQADEVLAGLPRSRPQRRSPKRDAARAKAAAAPAAGAKPRAAGKAGAPAGPPPRGYAIPADSRSESEDLASVAIKTAEELVGLGGRVLKGILDRLPRP